MEFYRQEHWNGLQFSPPGDLPDPGIKPVSPASPGSAGEFFTTQPPQVNNQFIIYPSLYFIAFVSLENTNYQSPPHSRLKVPIHFLS